MEFYSFHLFAGIGGGILADVALGVRTVGAVELDPFCRSVLLSRQADCVLCRFPIWDDVRSFGRDNPATFPFIDRLCSIRENLIISGGFPCQDISIAGKRKGIRGEKSGLWFEFARIVREIRPGFVFLENSPELVRSGLSDILTEFAALGYSFCWGIIPASAVGAFHLRRRFWGVACADSNLQHCKKFFQFVATSAKVPRLAEFCRALSYSSFKRAAGLFGQSASCSASSSSLGTGEKSNGRREWGEFESGVDRISYGFSDWLDEFGWFDPREKGIPRIIADCSDRTNKLRALGNAQVPACAAFAFCVLLSRFLSF
ncbi:MAG: DNA cytosine methyltransferase [Thermoguttaceae bacterium]|nr:DNA cytosine methyltransferase [Thermoguttaceae bacterium]